MKELINTGDNAESDAFEDVVWYLDGESDYK